MKIPSSIAKTIVSMKFNLDELKKCDQIDIVDQAKKLISINYDDQKLNSYLENNQLPNDQSFREVYSVDAIQQIYNYIKLKPSQTRYLYPLICYFFPVLVF